MQIRKQLFRFCSQQVFEHEAKMENIFNKLGENDTHVFHDYMIYRNNMDMKDLNKTVNLSYIGYSVLWSGLSYFTYSYIHPYATILPAFFIIQTIASFYSIRRYTGRLVKQITLNSDMEHCELEFFNKQKLNVKISDNELLDVKDFIPKDEKNEEINKKYRDSSYVILFETTVNDKLYEQLRVMVLDESKITNHQILKAIVSGESVKEFTFQEKKEESNKELTDEELTQKIKDELKI